MFLRTGGGRYIFTRDTRRWIRVEAFKFCSLLYKKKNRSPPVYTCVTLAVDNLFSEQNNNILLLLSTYPDNAKRDFTAPESGTRRKKMHTDTGISKRNIS